MDTESWHIASSSIILSGAFYSTAVCVSAAGDRLLTTFLKGTLSCGSKNKASSVAEIDQGRKDIDPNEIIYQQIQFNDPKEAVCIALLIVCARCLFGPVMGDVCKWSLSSS